MGRTYRSQIWGSCFLAVTVMMVWVLVYGSYIQVPNLGVTLFGGYCDDGVSAGIWSYIQVPNLGVTLFGNFCDDRVSAVTVTGTVTVTVTVTVIITLTITIYIYIHYVLLCLFRSSSLSSCPAPVLYPNSPKKNLNISILFANNFGSFFSEIKKTCYNKNRFRHKTPTTFLDST